MTKTVLSVKTDIEVKKKAQKLAKSLGVPLSIIVNAQLKKFIADGKIEFAPYTKELMNIEEISSKSLPIFKKYDISYVSLYGSYARGEATFESDVDFLIAFGRPLGLEYMTLHEELKEALGTDVDLITQENMSSYLRPFITKDLITLYEKK